MKKLLLATLLLGGFLFTSSAQAYEPFEVGIYSNIKSPASEAPNVSKGSKVGTATCRTVMGFVNWGDCSLEEAMKNGKITTVTGGDWLHKYILVYGTKTFRVYGE